MDRQYALHSFDLNQYAALDKNVELQRFFKSDVFIPDFDGLLVADVQSSQFEFTYQASLVNTFQETWPKSPVDLNRCCNN